MVSALTERSGRPGPRRGGSKQELVEGFRVESIQRAALRVISRRGLPDATMQEIADEAGIAKGTIYLYFKSREALVERTAEMCIAELLAQLDRPLRGGASFGERLRGLVRTHLAFFDERREFFRLYVALRDDLGDVEASARRRRRRRPQFAAYLTKVEALLREAMAAGEARRLDPARLALFLCEGLSAVALRRLLEDAPPDAEHDVAWITQLVLGGVAAGRQRVAS